MKRLHLYMVKSFIGPFIMTFILAMIVLILQFVWKWIDELAGKGLNWKVVAELLLYVSVRLGPRAMVLGVLLSSIMLFGNLGEHSELSALKSSGISLFKIMLPVLLLVFALGTGTFFFSNDVVPRTNLRFFTLLLDIRHKRPAFD
ncbi:MAG: LptF/LptG family permease, partial [Bacteroidales bacterium]|nr:LptF/LptG family permease [Bacteroidales bacterium]